MPEIRDATDEEKLQYLSERVFELVADLKLDGVVLFAETSAVHNVARWPPCPPTCRTKRHCAIKTYRHAADVLDRVADELEKLKK